MNDMCTAIVLGSLDLFQRPGPFLYRHPRPRRGGRPLSVPTTAPDLDLAALAGQPGPFMFGRGRGRFPPQVFAPDLPQVGAREESRSGRVEETAPEGMSYGLYPPRQVPESEDSGEESGVESLSNPLEAVGTPQEWGDSTEPEGAGEAGWVTRPTKKRALSGEHEEARGRKENPLIPLDPNPFQVLAGPEEGVDFCTGMDLELVSPLPYQDWVPDGLADSLGDILKTPGAGDLGDLGGANAL
ncbi:hypothetical protein AAFF_G00436970 [Aldrovandia affinis]|uniref:Uncharacterized protein n=1 Tax=Aldrovandia affinis TaxID=143900 RepID=A0AAD7R2V6_9TELE|nr:hypothetical protein AAFF_G00436970 [Aldrovandia affinis]